ncbi:MAG: AraC family transcriptional regulator [Marivirga sp.]|nr:AraC family transcriptional regulator [Marivirga sp.]
MKAVEIRLLKEQDQSFLLYHETNPFSRWHYHPDFELVLITKGTGKRMVGDHIDRFEEGDLVLLGSNLPHEWLCDDEYFSHTDGFRGEGIVIQFLENFLGDAFMKIPENKKLKKILNESSQGLLLCGNSKDAVTGIIKRMLAMDADSRLYALLHIFGILSKTTEYVPLSSPGFITTFQADENAPMKKVIQYLLQHFQENISVTTLLEIANMSSTSFSVLFKRTYNMTFKEYLVKVRVGYACRLLGDNEKNISQISYEAGFENISNFNRLFKNLKGITPSDYRKNVAKSEQYASFYAGSVR